MSEVAIEVSHVDKVYRLYNKPSDRLKEAIGFSRKKRYKEHYALHDVNFTVHKGETVGIIGTNGSGKSTILKIITGVLNPTAGQLSIEGRISALLELGAGFNMEYNGIDNIYLNGTMIGFSREEVGEKLEDILAFADIGEFIYQPVKTYSSGMFVRLAFAVAINIDPEILIVDEALSVGDVFFQAKCYKKFEEFKQLGKTILFVSHDLGSITKYCDRVVLLNNGCKEGEGSPREMVEIYKKILVNQHQKDNTTGKDASAEGEMKQSMLINPNFMEYGNQQAEIIDFGIFDGDGELSNTIIKMEDFTIRMKVRFYQEIVNPIFAFCIKDLKGTDISGTNTAIEKTETGTLAAGETIEVEFTQKMVLQGGQYLLQLGCTGYEGDDLVVFHRLYDICMVQVIADKTTTGYFDLDSQVKYTRRQVHE